MGVGWLPEGVDTDGVRMEVMLGTDMRVGWQGCISYLGPRNWMVDS
jgi:hypothetical protein